MARAKGTEKTKVAKYKQEDSVVQEASKQIHQIKLYKKFKNQKQKELYNKILNNKITIVKGPAGSGKTFIVLMSALECLFNKRYNIEKIAITKPIIESAKSIGFLKGSLEEKTMQYFLSFYDNFDKLIGSKNTELLRENKYITENVINFIRGNTFGSQDLDGNPIGHFCILDECQNLSIGELKTYISRIATDSKMVILGDTDQIDVKLKPGELNALDFAYKYLSEIDDVDVFEFTEDDIVRDPILIEIMKKFKEYDNR